MQVTLPWLADHKYTPRYEVAGIWWAYILKYISENTPSRSPRVGVVIEVL